MLWRWCSSGDRPAAAAARDLGIGESTPVNWVRQARIDRGDRCGLTTSERTELVELRRENARLPMVRELLKGATAFAVLELGHRPATAGPPTTMGGPTRLRARSKPSQPAVRICARFAATTLSNAG